MRTLRAIDLCGGAGGWACAAESIGRPSPIDIVAAVDYWPEACKTYRLNHPEVEVIQTDLRDPAVIDDLVAQFRGIDLVLGAIPCEWLSQYRTLWRPKPDEIAANRATLDACLDCVQRIAPRWWCLEDVIRLRRELPPLTPYQVLDARWWSPQRRKRLFVGVFPPPPHASDAAALMAGDRLRPGPYRVGARLYGRKLGGFGTTDTLALHPDAKAHTICGAFSSRHDGELGVIARVPGGLRQFEWQEAARLQGFPEDYLFYGSPTAVSKLVAQAVQIELAAAILAAIVAEAERNQTALLGDYAI